MDDTDHDGDFDWQAFLDDWLDRETFRDDEPPEPERHTTMTEPERQTTMRRRNRRLAP